MQEHAISVTIEQYQNDLFMRMSIVGKLKHSDYEILNPMMDEAIAGIEGPKIKVLVNLLEFTGYEMHALWDDLKFGLKYNREFTKIAVVGNNKWEEIGIKIGDWFTHADMHYFESEAEALTWLAA